jgi:hypothetical protein
VVMEEMLSRKRTEISDHCSWSSKFREVSTKCNTKSEIQYHNILTAGKYGSPMDYILIIVSLDDKKWPNFILVICYPA